MANIQENICALCDAAIDIHIVMDHECYNNGCTKIHVDDAGYVYPQLDNDIIVDPNEINNEPLTEILWNERLIGEVRKRQVLWNFKMPVTERSLSMVQKLWEEVVSAMKGYIKDVNEAKNIWKKLRYDYRLILIRESNSKKSGSAGNRMKKNKWPYYEMMAFTKDLFIENRKRSSNVSVSNLYNDDTMISVASTSSSSSVPEIEAKKKRRSSESNEAILIKLITSLLDAPLPPQPELVLPPLPAMPPQNDEIENVIGLIRATLNRIPLSKRHECIVELLTFLYSRENSYK